MFAEVEDVRAGNVRGAGSPLRPRAEELVAANPEASSARLVVDFFASGDAGANLPLAHLWFLYYLLIFIVVVAVLAPLLARFTGTPLLARIDAAFRYVIGAAGVAGGHSAAAHVPADAPDDVDRGYANALGAAVAHRGLLLRVLWLRLDAVPAPRSRADVRPRVGTQPRAREFRCAAGGRLGLIGTGVEGTQDRSRSVLVAARRVRAVGTVHLSDDYRAVGRVPALLRPRVRVGAVSGGRLVLVLPREHHPDRAVPIPCEGLASSRGR